MPRPLRVSKTIGTWLEAVRVIPRISKDEWDELDLVARWLVATRAAVLVMTFVSSAIAGLLALRAGKFHALTWGLVTLGLLFAHATNNLVNDLTDHAKGVDRGDYFRARYGPQPLEHGLLTKLQMARYIAVTFAVALAAGIALVVMRGGATLTLMLVGIVFVAFYTWPMKYYGLGELAVIIVWGPLMVGGGYYVITGALDPGVIAASLPFSLGATTVIFGKHIDKLDQDREKKIRTLPVLLGERHARAAVVAMLVLQYAILVGLVLGRFFSPAVLLVGLAVPALLRTVRTYGSPRPSEPPANFPAKVWPLWFVAFAFDHNRRFGLYYLAGLVLDVVLHRMRELALLA
jgi:1,4-dihydroxy-2-naphthoate octaprenyltransferase